MTTVRFEDLGNIDYQKAWDYQEYLFNKIILQKKDHVDTSSNILETDNYLLFCEHPHVYTLGKSGSENNLLLNYIQLQAKNACFYKINRGGDITYHGPGQIVGYPILNLEQFNLSVKEYIYKIEEAIIEMLKTYNIKSDRLPGATGVWIDIGIKGKERKICAIGVRASRYVTMHGFALNVNTDLSYFSHINPCGFVDKGVTSIANELGYSVDFTEAKQRIKKELEKEFQILLK